jgi:hypothetical protein
MQRAITLPDDDQDPFAHIPKVEYERDETQLGSRGPGLSIDRHVNGPKRPPPIDHRKRSANYYRRQGYIYAPTETRDIAAGGDWTRLGKKHDLLGFMDAIAFMDGVPGILGVQICSTGGHTAHIRKACSEEIDAKSGRKRIDNLKAWLSAGNRFVVIEWQRRQKVGNQEWFPVEHEVTLNTIELVISRRRK